MLFRVPAQNILLKSYHLVWCAVRVPHPESAWGCPQRAVLSQPWGREPRFPPEPHAFPVQLSTPTWVGLGGAITCPVLYVLCLGRTHPHRDLRVSCRCQPCEQNSFSLKGCTPLPLSLPLPVHREQGGGGGHVYPPAFLGRLRAPPGASSDTPTQKHPRNGLSSAPPILGTSSTAAASGVPGKPLRVPPSGPMWFEGSWAIGGGALPPWPHASRDGVNMSPGSGEAD